MESSQRNQSSALGNVQSRPTTVDGKCRSGLVRFRKHHRPCGQPAAVGGIGRFRPEPAQAGHFKRINATPSGFPFKSTGFVTYPVPPQFGQSSGLTPFPLSVAAIVAQFDSGLAADFLVLRIPNKNGEPATRQKPLILAGSAKQSHLAGWRKLTTEPSGLRLRRAVWNDVIGGMGPRETHHNRLGGWSVAA